MNIVSACGMSLNYRLHLYSSGHLIISNTSFFVGKRIGRIKMLPDNSALSSFTENDDDYDFALELRPDDAYR